MVATFLAATVTGDDCGGTDSKKASQRRRVGNDRVVCPCCGGPLTFGDHLVRCERSLSHYTRVSLPSPSMGEVWGLLGQPWARLRSMRHSIPKGWRDGARQPASSVAR
jgi:hypothetical protein